MQVEKIRYSEQWRSAWEEFVSQSVNGTFLHSRAFFDHNPLNGQEDHSLLFLKKGKVIALFPANAAARPTGTVLHSYSRSTYGGLVVDAKASVADLMEVADLLIDEAKSEGFAEIIVRPSFRIYHSDLADEQDYVFWMKGFGIRARELELAMNLEHDIRKGYDDTTLRGVKKAAKMGVTVREDGDLAQYWALLTANLQEKHGVKPVHDLQEIQTLIDLVGPDKVKLFTAHLGDAMVGGVLVFLANRRVAHAQYIASDFAYQEYRPANAVLDAIAFWAQKEGFKYFNLGMATEPGGLTINPGLFRFKEGFGARSTLRETLHFKLDGTA